MPDPLEYCNAEVQYLMLLTRSFTVNVNRQAHISHEDIFKKIKEINREFPAMLSTTGREKVRNAFYDFWNKGAFSHLGGEK